MKHFGRVGFAVAALACASPLAAQQPVTTEKFALRDGFVFPADGAVRILVFRPDIKVGEQTTGGLFQPNAEWNDAARKALTQALRDAKSARKLDAVFHEENAASDSKALADYRALFRAIVGSAIRHKLFQQDPLPSKAARFDWSLGNGVAAIAPQSGADYGLFLFSHDGYESPGRKAAQLVASLMGAKDDPGSHFGYAGLVDLRTGDLVWLNVDLKTTGDVRTAEGATARIDQLLAGFPARAAGAAQ
jgi:hypothetical protein